jgi:hypothetical protein
MIPAIETAGFFLVITAALRFSTWAEGWLTSPARVKARAPDATSPAAGDFAQATSDHEAVQAA